jgi:succinyl-CoA synthetase beta subunit
MNAADVEAAYADLAGRIGKHVLVAPMTAAGLEMSLGMVQDEQFGPLVMMGFGGVHLEAMKDVVYALPPFDAATARRLLMRLRQRALFEHDRGQGRPDLYAFCQAATAFSVMVASLADEIDEIDINPLIVHPEGCVAVDALIVPAADRARTRRKTS